MKRLADWLDYIGAVHPSSIQLGLERVQGVADRLGVREHPGKTLIVAGTNGKGSTCIFAEHLLRAAGFNVGTTLSPHLKVFNERIRVDGRCVDDAEICAAFERVEAARGDVQLTYFEFAILAALCVFHEANVDVRVLEVGLGGRLDAVNVCTPAVSVVTSVGLDHQEYLGNDRESIGFEKAGVFRAGVPAVIGERTPPESVLRHARTLGAPVYQLGDAFDFEVVDDGWRYRARLEGAVVSWPDLAVPERMALVNAATAMTAVELLGFSVERGHLDAALAQPGLPGRLDVRQVGQKRVVLDVAHNVLGAEFLAGQLDELGGVVDIAVAGFLQDKDVAGIVAALADRVGHWVFVDTGGARGQSAAKSLSKSGLSPRRGSLCADLEAALGQGVDRADGTVLVLGSFDVVERAGRQLESA